MNSGLQRFVRLSQCLCRGLCWWDGAGVVWGCGWLGGRGPGGGGRGGLGWGWVVSERGCGGGAGLCVWRQPSIRIWASWGVERISRPVWLVRRFAVEALSDVAVPSLGLPGGVKGRTGTGAARPGRHGPVGGSRGALSAPGCAGNTGGRRTASVRLQGAHSSARECVGSSRSQGQLPGVLALPRPAAARACLFVGSGRQPGRVGPDVTCGR